MLKRIIDALKTIQAVQGVVPFVCGIFNNFLTQAIPITPLLRGLALLILIVFCTYAILLALSFSNDTPIDPTGNAKLRRRSCAAFICGLILLFGYFAFVAYANERRLQSPVLDQVVDVAQAVLFVLPWAFWSYACVLAGPREKRARTVSS
jgi:hypothetical protein